jgi:hypothetical protein
MPQKQNREFLPFKKIVFNGEKADIITDVIDRVMLERPYPRNMLWVKKT